jgi:hypothetical protein
MATVPCTALRRPARAAGPVTLAEVLVAKTTSSRTAA